MNSSVYDEIVRLSLKRELTPEDRMRIEAAIAAHPELRERWEMDAALSRALRGIPDVPVSSNFTTVVMEAIDLEARATERSRGLRLALPQWLRPRVAAVFGVVVVVGFGIYQYRDRHDRVELAMDIRQVSREFAALPPSVPGPEIFHDFEAIDKLWQVSVVSDEELLKVLQQ